MRRFALLCVVVILLLLIAACSSSSNVATITGVTVSCLPSPIQSNQQNQCVATVTGTGPFQTTVTWKTTVGSILTDGVFTAPLTSTPIVATITGTSMEDTSKSGMTTVTINPVNALPITVDAGPEPQNFTAVNEAFTSVTLCLPNTNTCQTIDHVLVDTGSSGLRLLSSAVTLPLPQQNASSGNPLDECTVFADGYVWGPVALADIALADERAFSTALQLIIPSSSSPAVPDSCSSQSPGPNQGNSVSALGANGILGVGLFQQDCGAFCALAYGFPPVYYECPASGCSPTSVTLAQQVPNPVIKFSLDNNGVLIYLPAVPVGGVPAVTGSLIFGIGTQTNNALGNATVYTVNDFGLNARHITTILNGVSYSSTINSGTSAIVIPNNPNNGIPTCIVQGSPWYCPVPSPDALSAVNQGENGNQGVVNFSIEDASKLLNSSNTAFSTLSAPAPLLPFYDWGLPFFFGRTVYTAIDGMNTPAGFGPYYAY